MSSFDDRKNPLRKNLQLIKSYNLRSQDEETSTLANGRLRNFKKDQDIENYIDEVIKADLKEAGDMDLISKVLEDFKAASQNITEDEIKTKLDEFLEKAKADFQ